MKAHIYGHRTSAGRGRKPSWTYFMVVEDSQGTVVLTDNGRASTLPSLIDSARRMVAAVRVVEGYGQSLRPWRDVVDEAGDDL